MYPSKRYFIGLGVLIALVGIFFGIVQLTEQLKLKRERAREAERIALDGLIVARAQQGLSTLSDLDTDSDGLVDWKEALWQLDPKNPDTDGNGVLDGEQIRLVEAKLQADAGVEDSKKLTTLDLLARDIYTTATVLEQSGQLTSETSARLTDQVAQSIYASTTVTQYTPNDLEIVPADQKSRATYVALLNQATSTMKTSDLQIILESATVTDKSKIDPVAIAAVLQKYDTIIQKLLKIPVPSTAAQAHVDLINALARFSANITGIANADEDPLAGFSGIVQIKDTLEQLSTIVGN